MNETIENKIETKLNNIPETMLWTLRNRAIEALRRDAIIKDEKAVKIFNSISYDYEKNFGKADASHAVRSLDFDREISKFLQKHPSSTIVNLGEGLETQRYRVKHEQALWITVDLPEAINIREIFIKADLNHLHLKQSATNIKWFESCKKDKPVLICAQGLFMYFNEKELSKLINDIYAYFDEAYILFDTIPKFLSNKTMSKNGWKKTKTYTTPKMPWGINRKDVKSFFQDNINKNIFIEDIGYSIFPRGVIKYLSFFLNKIKYLKNITPSIIRISFNKKLYVKP